MNQEITCENIVSPEIIDTSNNDDAGTSWSVNKLRGFKKQNTVRFEDQSN